MKFENKCRDFIGSSRQMIGWTRYDGQRRQLRNLYCLRWPSYRAQPISCLDDPIKTRHLFSNFILALLSSLLSPMTITSRSTNQLPRWPYKNTTFILAFHFNNDTWKVLDENVQIFNRLLKLKEMNPIFKALLKFCTIKILLKEIGIGMTDYGDVFQRKSGDSVQKLLLYNFLKINIISCHILQFAVFCQGTSTRCQRSDLFGLWVKLFLLLPV